MKILIKNATIIDDKSLFHLKKRDVLIVNGIYTQIDQNITSEDAKIIDAKDLYLSKGWIDSSCSLGFPGFEERENITNGINTAAKSGFTHLMITPNTNPVADNVSVTQNISYQSVNQLVNLLPIGAFTQKMQGENLSELYDFYQNGVTTYYDYKKSISDYNLIKIGLQYVQDFGGILQVFPSDLMLKGKGFVNEGAESTQLGLKGNANISEFSTVQKIINILEYTGGRVHFATISTSESVDLIKKAQKKGLAVSCSVAVHQLLFTDEKLRDFDTNYKVNPPLRTQKDQEALIAGVLDGTIAIICTDHNPINIEEKEVEFELAKDGTIGLESAFTALNTIFSKEIIVEKLTNAYQLFGYKTSEIAIGKPANCTIFQDTEAYVFTDQNILSSSKNSLFINQKVKGRVLGVVNNGKVMMN